MTPYPVMKISGRDSILRPTDLVIVAEGHQLTRDDCSMDILFGASLLMATYWIYGFQYPTTLKKTFSLLEILLNLKSKQVNPAALKLRGFKS